MGVLVVLALCAFAYYYCGYCLGVDIERGRHRVLHTYTARAQGYIMSASCHLAIGRLAAAVAAHGGKIEPTDVDEPFSYRQASGPVAWAAVVKFRAPGDFKAPGGWVLYKDR